MKKKRKSTIKIMRFDPGDTVKVCVTRASSKQKLGLGLEERFADALSADTEISSSSRIYVSEIKGGLYDTLKVPVHVGDELLEINGMASTNKDHFPNGVKDIRKFLKNESSILIKVRKGSEDVSEKIKTVDSVPCDSSIESTSHVIHEDPPQLSVEPKPQRSTRNLSFRESGRTEKRKEKRKRSKKKKVLEDSDDHSTGTCTTEPTHRTGSTDSIPQQSHPESIQLKSSRVLQSCKSSAPVSPITLASFARSFKKKSLGIEVIRGDGNEIRAVLEGGELINIKSEPILITPHEGRLVIHQSCKTTNDKESILQNIQAPSLWFEDDDGDADQEEENLHDSNYSNYDYDDRSTISCLTNLIEKGDLMKIDGFKSRPEMNGSIVEVVRRSRRKEHRKTRWDVRLVENKDDSEIRISSDRLISVNKRNLKHFL